MISLVIRWVFFALALLFTAWLIPGIILNGFVSALWVVFVMGLVNIFIRPILLILTLPINLLTLGLFTFIINALMFLLVSKIVHGFVVEGFLTALLGSMVLSALSVLINRIEI